MIEAGIRLITPFFPIEISLWSIALAVVITVSATQFIARHMSEAGGEESHPSYLLAGIIATFWTMVSLVLHELAHAWVSIRMGVEIVEAGIHGLGAYVKPETPLPYTSPFIEITVALAGPMTNLAIAGVCWLIVRSLGESHFENTVQYLAFANFSMGELNLLPILGLDGHKVLHGVMWLFMDTNTALIWSIAVGIAITVAFNIARRRLPSWEDIVDC